MAIITPEQNPVLCPQHGSGQYQDSLTCPACRILAKQFLYWAAFQVPKSYSVVAFTGSSGSAFGYWFADEFGLTPVQIFKEGEYRHGKNKKLDRYKTAYSAEGWVFLDDFIATGATLRRVQEEMGSKPRAVICYMPSSVSTSRAEDLGIHTLITRPQ